MGKIQRLVEMVYEHTGVVVKHVMIAPSNTVGILEAHQLGLQVHADSLCPADKIFVSENEP